MTHKFLKKTSEENSLKLFKNKSIRSYEDLLYEIKNLKEKEYREFIKNKYDVLLWIQDNYGDEELIDNLKDIETKKEYEKTLERRINNLKEEEKELIALIKQRNQIIKRKTNYFPKIWISLYLLFFAIIIFQHAYHTGQNNDLRIELYDSQYLSRVIDEENQLLKEQEQTMKEIIEKLNNTVKDLNYQVTHILNETSKLDVIKTNGPESRITEEQIILTKNGVLITIDNPLFAKFVDTKSMIPLINSKTKAIQIIPTAENDIKIGDIISFELGNKIIIHRVIEIGEDENGWYAITKGDNAIKPDIEKVRFEQIKRLLVVIIY